MKKLLSILLTLTLALCLLAGCGGQTTEEPAEEPTEEPAQLEKIVFTEPVRGYTWAPAYLAQTLGYYAQEGLDAEFRMATGAGGDTAIFSGDAQFTLKGIEMALMANEAGQGCKIVASTGQKYPYQLIGAGEEYATLESLRGGVVAGGQSATSGPYAFMGTCLRSAGLEMGTDVTAVNMASSAYAAAIDAGEVQAVVGTNPWSCKLLVDNGGVVIVDGTDPAVISQLIGTDSYELFAVVASDAYLAEHPETVQKTVNAIAKAMQWMETATAEEIAESLLPLFEDRYDELLYDAQYDQSHQMTSYTGYHTPAGFAAGVEMTKRSGGITSDLTEAQVYDESFLDAAWAALQ